MASRHGIVSAAAAEDFRAVQARLAAAPDTLRGLIDATAADQLSRAWGEELDKSNPTPVQRHFILDGTSASPANSGLWVRTGDPEAWPAFEFGTLDQEHRTTYYRSPTKNRRGGSVTRRTRRQVPPRKPGGYVAYPAANRLGSRVFNMWAELITKVVGDAFDGGK